MKSDEILRIESEYAKRTFDPFNPLGKTKKKPKKKRSEFRKRLDNLMRKK